MSDAPYDPFGGPLPGATPVPGAPDPEPPPPPPPPTVWMPPTVATPAAPPPPGPEWGTPGPDPRAPVGGGWPAAPVGEVVRPRSIKVAVLLMWIGAGLSLVSGLLVLAFRDDLREEVEREAGRQGTTEIDVDVLVQIALVIAVVAIVVGVALWVLNAVFCGRGHNWSRILASVLFAFDVLGFVVGLVQPATATSRISGVVSFLVALGAVVLLWTPDSNRFFEESGRARRAARGW